MCRLKNLWTLQSVRHYIDRNWYQNNRIACLMQKTKRVLHFDFFPRKQEFGSKYFPGLEGLSLASHAHLYTILRVFCLESQVHLCIDPTAWNSDKPLIRFPVWKMIQLEPSHSQPPRPGMDLVDVDLLQLSSHFVTANNIMLFLVNSCFKSIFTYWNCNHHDIFGENYLNHPCEVRLVYSTPKGSTTWLLLLKYEQLLLLSLAEMESFL